MKFRSASPQGELNGFLDAGSHMTGELSFEDTFRIDGKLTGKIVSGGDLIVGENGKVDGEIEVRRVFVSGAVHGTVRVSERVEITATGKVFADLFTPTLTIEEGAFFEGRCSMGKKERAAIGAEGSARSGKVTQMPMAK
jgi:cytoskeletal protein CcmA (bactofilin family)